MEEPKFKTMKRLWIGIAIITLFTLIISACSYWDLKYLSETNSTTSGNADIEKEDKNKKKSSSELLAEINSLTANQLYQSERHNITNNIAGLLVYSSYLKYNYIYSTFIDKNTLNSLMRNYTDTTGIRLIPLFDSTTNLFSVAIDTVPDYKNPIIPTPIPDSILRSYPIERFQISVSSVNCIDIINEHFIKAIHRHPYPVNSGHVCMPYNYFKRDSTVFYEKIEAFPPSSFLIKNEFDEYNNLGTNDLGIIVLIAHDGSANDPIRLLCFAVNKSGIHDPNKKILERMWPTYP